MDFLPVRKWLLHSKKPVDTDAQKVEEGRCKADLLHAGEHLAEGRAKRPHLLFERQGHEGHDEPNQDVCQCKRDDEHVEALPSEPWTAKDDHDQDYVGHQDENSCAEFENAEERGETREKINRLPAAFAFPFSHPAQQSTC